jgi:DNA replication ATP-dependent helicase Dna2
MHGKTDGCFLCAHDYDHISCAVPAVEGIAQGIVAGGGRGQVPALTLGAEDGATYRIALQERDAKLLRELLALPAEIRRRLRLRVYHLQRAADALPDGTIPLQTTHASLVVLEPDVLLNITDINNAEYCVRQYVLRRMVPSAPTTATLRGTLIHQVFKEMLKSGAPQAGGHLRRGLRLQLADLALRQLTLEHATADAEPHLRALQAWYAGQRQSLWRQAPRIRAETFLLAPEIGLKGRLDVLLQDEQGDALLELKTGDVRASLPKRQHRWQVHGYQALLAVRHPHDQRRGRAGATLLYSGTPGSAEAYGIPFTLRDLHRVVELRNALALTHATGTVPAPPGARTCARCSVRRECARASALLGWQPPELDEAPEPLSREDGGAFARMYRLLWLEARAAEEQGEALWRLSPEERSAAGSALGGLALDGAPRMTESGEWEYRFRCEQTSELREGDAILLSDGDPVLGEVVSGTVLRLEQGGITVWTPERIANPALIDRYDSDIVHDRTVRNLWRWLEAEPRLRALVAGRQAPTFDEGLQAADLAQLPVMLNVEQRAAVARARAARDFLLVQGPPGTGKTSVVAEIVKRAVARGERVLVAAFTNQAVDNALRRLLKEGVSDIVRLGHELSVAAELHPYRLIEQARRRAHGSGHDAEMDADPEIEPRHVRAALWEARVVAATTATWSAERYDGVGEPLEFDLAIVDEATQLTVPSILGALRFARRFVLVGDAQQLPPLVMSQEAAERGLKQSLFAALLERWGDGACMALRRQYRMHPVICEFASREFYDGSLVTEGEAETALLELAEPVRGPVAPVLDPAHPMVFVDVPKESGAAALGKASVLQALATARLAAVLRRAGMPSGELGVIAPYRAQVAAIRQRLAAEGEDAIMVDTVDRFQGGERQVILFSFGGETPRGLQFLADPHRLNVALTRAQRKLILLGNRRQLEQEPLLRRLLAYCAALYGGRGGMISARPA